MVALRAQNLRERLEADRFQMKGEELELRWAQFRFDAADAVRNNADKVQEIMAGSGNNDEKTEALGRLIFGEEWER